MVESLLNRTLDECLTLTLAGQGARVVAHLNQLLQEGPIALETRARLARILAAQSPANSAVSAALDADASEGWRQTLARARFARQRGDTIAAAELLRHVVDEVRADPTLGAFEDLAAFSVRLEVEALRIKPGDKPTKPADAPTSELLGLVKFAARMTNVSDPELALRLILEEALRLTESDHGFVVTPHDGELEIVAAHACQPREHDPTTELSRSLLRECLTARRAVWTDVPALPASHAAHQSLIDQDVGFVGCIPIVADELTLGALYLARRRPRSAVDRDLNALVQPFVQLAAAALNNATKQHETERALLAAEQRLRSRPAVERRDRYHLLIGSSAAMEELYARLDRVVQSDLSVVIHGETGSGKELVARTLHERGPRAQQAFIAINCAGFNESLLESELFGHEAGAFTGAQTLRPGLFEEAHLGTLFLDEVAEMSARMQADLLRVLESGELRRVGGRETLRVDVRIVAATHRDLKALVARGDFRSDLFYRLSVATLELPPLRERPSDIPLLIESLHARHHGPDARLELSVSALRRLTAYSWPGNVRELDNAVRRLGLLGDRKLTERDLPSEIRQPTLARGRLGTLRELERDAIQHALKLCQGNKSRASKLLGIDRATLHRKLKASSG